VSLSMSEADELALRQRQRTIRVYQHKILYHYTYGILAAVCVVMAALICVAAVISIILRQAFIGPRRFSIDSLSSGRPLRAFLFPADGDPQADTKAWLESVGRRSICLLGPTVDISSQLEKPNARIYSLVDHEDNRNGPRLRRLRLRKEILQARKGMCLDL
jgi:hypothetical protein